MDLTYSVALYNSIVLYAHAATKVLSEGKKLQDGQAVTNAVRATTFEGVGGRLVSLDNETGDQIDSYEVVNYVADEDYAVSSVPVGVYDQTLRQYRALERAIIVWPNGSDTVPKDWQPGECAAGNEPKILRNSMLTTCITCDGYGLDGLQCFKCPNNADCWRGDIGYDIVAHPGYWRGQVLTD